MEIKLLDCTLRDGGYLNNWDFGKDAVWDITDQLSDTGVEIVEVGFLRNEPYYENRTVFSSMEQVKKVIGKKKPGVEYAVMAEIANPFPLEMLEPADEDSADIIRVIIWKTKHDKDGNVVDALEEGYRYCKGVVEKGYKLCVQPARVDQYSDAEFTAMVERFSQLNPMAIYVVDSWGTQNAEKMLHYMHLADEKMPQGIKLGYHGHNNMMQALSVAQAMIKEGFSRDIMIDASVFGIGRGAGNLNLEIIAKYLNEEHGKSYDVHSMIKVFTDYIRTIYEKVQWGYSMHYYLTAMYNCNPTYAGHYSKLLPDVVDNILGKFSPQDKIMYKPAKADAMYRKYAKKN